MDKLFFVSTAKTMMAQVMNLLSGTEQKDCETLDLLASLSLTVC